MPDLTEAARGVRDAWTGYLEWHSESVPDAIRAAVREAVGDWLDGGGLPLSPTSSDAGLPAPAWLPAPAGWWLLAVYRDVSTGRPTVRADRVLAWSPRRDRYGHEEGWPVISRYGRMKPVEPAPVGGSASRWTELVFVDPSDGREQAHALAEVGALLAARFAGEAVAGLPGAGTLSEVVDPVCGCLLCVRRLLTAAPDDAARAEWARSLGVPEALGVDR